MDRFLLKAPVIATIVMVAEFMELIHPHFKTARFSNSNKSISIENNPDALIEYLSELASNNTTDDILFSE